MVLLALNMESGMTPSPLNVSLDDLLAILGEKEVLIYSLRSENAKLRQEVAKLTTEHKKEE